MTEVNVEEKVVSPMPENKAAFQPSLFNLGEKLGNVLKDAVAEATNIALSQAVQPLQVILPDNKEIKEVAGFSHEKTPTILRILSARLPLFLVGEAGSGKTNLVEQCAEALGLKFYCISVCAQTTASTLLGYMDANGKYVRSLFREAYENGGVFLLDEVDNGNPNVLSVLNASISNHVCSFPDQMVKKHPDFILCASGNTYGHGANRRYVGRLEIDAATLDRFVFVEIGYDEKLENNICGDKNYAKLIQSLRKKAEELKLRNIISPRASINGVKLLKSGLDIRDVLKYTVFRDMSEDTIKQLTEKNKDYKKALEKLEQNGNNDAEPGGKKKSGKTDKNDTKSTDDKASLKDMDDGSFNKLVDDAVQFYHDLDGEKPDMHGFYKNYKKACQAEGEIKECAF